MSFSTFGFERLNLPRSILLFIDKSFLSSYWNRILYFSCLQANSFTHNSTNYKREKHCTHHPIVNQNNFTLGTEKCENIKNMCINKIYFIIFYFFNHIKAEPLGWAGSVLIVHRWFFLPEMQDSELLKKKNHKATTRISMYYNAFY